ncbi:MAG: 23S rRNA (pseudouridine(1915)-N(3))-methyltransferase RlmH [Candidatus Dojkabacteria bacterium]
MQKIEIVTFGKNKLPGGLELQEHYLKLIAKYTTVERRALKDPGDRKISTKDISLKKISYPVLVDQAGKSYDSQLFAAHISKLIELHSTISLIVGNAWGFDDEIKTQVPEKLSLSQFTIAHDLAVIVLVEQLFRALNICRSGKYHK